MTRATESYLDFLDLVCANIVEATSRHHLGRTPTHWSALTLQMSRHGPGVFAPAPAELETQSLKMNPIINSTAIKKKSFLELLDGMQSWKTSD